MKKKGISGSTLKIIAMIAMLLDHIGLVICGRMMMEKGYMDLVGANEETVMAWVTANADLYSTYYMFRMVGRIAFPIFAFLLVEGFKHTKDAKKYALRLAVFALISEIPFDLALQSKVISFDYQNIFFTLAIGVATMQAYKWVEEKQIQNVVTRVLLWVLVVMAGMAAALILRTDYGALGVFVMIGLYIFRESRFYQIAVIGLAFIQNMTAWFSMLPILIYNEKRGLNLKWPFYIFYPVHLLVLFAVCCFMGIAGYSAI